jgi:arsenate reductase
MFCGKKMKKILFLCTGNSCRSQIAEGWARHLLGDKYRFFSAGTKKHGLNQRAVKVMKEAGVDISMHESNTTDELPESHMDFVFTVCSDAHENCPYFPGGKTIHIGFDDPPRLTSEMDDEEVILDVYRRVRDEIKETVQQLESYMESSHE